MAKLDKTKFSEELREILKGYTKAYKQVGQKLIDKILLLINDGYPVTKAVQKALNETDFIGVNKAAITDAVYLAACAGYGILPTMVTDVAAKNIKAKLLSKSWAPDKMKLSHRLHKQGVYNKVVQTITSSMDKAQSIVEMARQIYDGYSSGVGVLDHAQLTRSMDKLYKLALQAVHGNKLLVEELNAAIDNFKKTVVAGKQTTNMKAAYNEFAEACRSLKVDAIEQAAAVAIEEKTRYYAERIARTESARAWFDGYIAERQDDKDVWGYKWVLSSRHHLVPFDQCDVCANMNVGFGKGIYPKNKVPSIPRHPHCMCMLEDIFTWEIEDKTKKIQPNGARKYIDSLSDAKQVKLFGIDGAKQYKNGDDWQKLLRGWSGFKKPTSRLNKDDFKLKADFNNGKIKSGSDASLKPLPNYKQAVIPDAKIFDYALNMDHPVGRNKAVVFENVLGYNKSNGDQLISAIRAHLPKMECTSRSGKYGVQYSGVISLTGPSGRAANVKIAWQIDQGTDFPRLISIYVDL